MLPTILEGDRVLVNKLAYDLKFPFTTWHIAQWGGPQRGDIVVFFSPEPVGTRLIKRCVGLPGDQLQVIRLITLIVSLQCLESLSQGQYTRCRRVFTTFAVL